VDESILKFTGTARVFESQDSAVEAILDHKIVAGDIVVIRYEGPRGGPGMQEMLYPTSYLKSKGLGKDCALITDGRFSGGSSGLSIGHVSPEAAEEAVPGAQEEILSGKIRATDREISSIAKVPKEKRPEVVAELRKPKGERDSSITDSYSSPSKGNEFITTFKQDIQGHKKGLNKEEKQNLKDAVKSIYSPRRLADGEAMMCEIQGAQEDFVRRWEMCFREYPDILTEPKNNEKLLIFIDRASRYLQNVKKRLYSDGNQQS
jgi:hypothetical protein